MKVVYYVCDHCGKSINECDIDGHGLDGVITVNSKGGFKNLCKDCNDILNKFNEDVKKAKDEFMDGKSIKVSELPKSIGATNYHGEVISAVLEIHELLRSHGTTYMRAWIKDKYKFD